MKILQTKVSAFPWFSITGDDEFRLRLHTRLIAIFTLVSCFYSNNLWFSDRVVPTVAIVSFLEDLPNLWHKIFWTARIVTAVILFYSPFSPILLALAVLSFFISAALDLARFQIFDFFFSLHLIVVLWGAQHSKLREALCLQRVMIVCMYFYAGLQKVNLDYFQDVVPWLLKGFGIWVDDKSHLNAIGLFMATVEMSLGVLLCFFRLRKIAVFLTLLLHGMVVYFFYFNLPFWPLIIYNLVQFVMVVSLFLSRERYALLFDLHKHLIPLCIFIFVAILPSLNFVGVWPSPLSFQYFSHSMIRADLYINKSKVIKPPIDIFYPSNRDPNYVSWGGWASPDIGYFFFSSRNYFESVFKKLCSKEEKNSELKVVLIYPSRFWRKGWREAPISCNSRMLGKEKGQFEN